MTPKVIPSNLHYNKSHCIILQHRVSLSKKFQIEAQRNIIFMRILTSHENIMFSQSLIGFADKIAEGEFIQGVMDNKDILRLIQFDEPKKIQDKLKEKNP